MLIRRRKANRLGWCVGLAMAALLLMTSLGRAAVSAELSRSDALELQRVERYLNDLGTLKARFTQITSNGETASGTFYLDRPGKMRLEYDPPLPYLYVADGFWLTFYDTELGQRNDVPLGKTLADFITRDNLSFSDDVNVTGVQADATGVAIDVVLTDDPGQGTLTLVFEKRPLRLTQWQMADGQGAVTQVLLDDPEFDITLPRALFRVPRDG